MLVGRFQDVENNARLQMGMTGSAMFAAQLYGIFLGRRSSASRVPSMESVAISFVVPVMSLKDWSMAYAALIVAL